MAWKLTSGLGLLLVALADGVGQGRDAPVGVRELLGTGHLRATDSLAVGGREGAVTLTTDLTDLRQVVRNFGASDAWCAQYVGTRDWPLARREQVADWTRLAWEHLGRARQVGVDELSVEATLRQVVLGIEDVVVTAHRHAESV